MAPVAKRAVHIPQLSCGDIKGKCKLDLTLIISRLKNVFLLSTNGLPNKLLVLVLVVFLLLKIEGLEKCRMLLVENEGMLLLRESGWYLFVECGGEKAVSGDDGDNKAIITVRRRYTLALWTVMLCTLPYQNKSTFKFGQSQSTLFLNQNIIKYKYYFLIKQVRTCNK